jgi:protein-tyrosine phosphatase
MMGHSGSIGILPGGYFDKLLRKEAQVSDQIATAHNIKFADNFFDYVIDGTAHQDKLSRRFEVPLVTQVEGNLWQGGVWPGVRLPDEFVNVVNLYGLSYELGLNTTEHKVIMHDSNTQTFERVDLLAQAIVTALDDGPLLVHCQAGLNRSGLLAARVLMLWKDYTAAQAINAVRRRSPVCLCNESFCNWLHGLD